MAEPSLVWGAGIVNHGGYDDLERCLESLTRQSHPPANVVVYDTGVDPIRFAAQRDAHPELSFVSGPNVGYAGGANRVVDRLREAGELAFVLVLNPDVLLDASFAERLIASVIPGTRRAATVDVIRLPGPRMIWSAVSIA